MKQWNLKGSGYELGTRTGALLKAEGENLRFDLDAFQTRLGTASGAVLRAYFPPAYEEAAGIADALGLPRERLLAFLMCMGCCLDTSGGPGAEVRGCTAFAFTSEGNTYYARNNDLPPAFRRVSKSILYEPEGGIPFLLNTSSFTNGEEGINAFGVVAAMTFVVPKPEELAPGLNSLFLVRYLLETCHTAAEGLAELQRLPVASPCNILLADRGGDMAVAECCPQGVRVRYPEKTDSGQYVAAVNRFLTGEMAPHDGSSGSVFYSKERYATVKNALPTLSGDPISFAKDVLSGKRGFLCQYPKALNFDTVWSTVFSLSGLTAELCPGNPGRVPFQSDNRLAALAKVSASGKR